MEIKLWEGTIPCFVAEADTPNTMRTFFLDTDKSLPCVVVLPGGGYRGRDSRYTDLFLRTSAYWIF